ncbi:MAG: N-acetylmuramoyl-L-alanine amidase [Dehalococcoidia bacterium]|nr:N-acetylmuramoyl-L-alanine amidase [Dehalococcoidia bacterium]
MILSIIALPQPPASRGAPPSPEIRAATLNPVLTQEADVNGWAVSTSRPGITGLSLRNYATWGLYNSPVYQADFPFNAVAISWRAQTPPGGQIYLEVRASPDGQEWSEWFQAESLDGYAPDGGEYNSQLIVARGSYLQYSATLYTADPELSPSLGEVKITYIDSSQGPAVTGPGVVGAFSRSPLDVGQPAIISRAGWGSPEPNSSNRWPPEYREWKKVIVHDTVTKNNDPDPAATMRAIWYYHANTLGWGDIGYNYLIDPYGNIYEGRFGGENVTGGHALSCYNPGSIGVALLGDYRYAEVSPAMEDALESLLAAKTYQHNINPLGSGFFGERWLNNIFSHRDVYGSCGNNHTDPGTYAYNRMPEFRQKVWDRYPVYSESWVDHNTPQRILAGATASVAVTVKNTGRAVWSASTAFRLGYRWYGLDGAEVFPAGNTSERAELPQDIPFGQTVMINAQITAPPGAGTYILRWDMVQEGVTWFASQGNPTLDLTVTVDEPTHIAAFAGQSASVSFFPGDKRQAWFELRNTGTATWYRSSPSPIKLGTWDPVGRSSPLATAGYWETPWRATYLDQDKVLPGQVGRFTFVATGAAQPGLYREHFRLVSEGKAWFGPDMYLDFNVLPSIKTYIPEVLRGNVGGW